jgi:hypothetical protein
MIWDLSLPSDAPEMKFLRESDEYRVYYYTASNGDTVYQGQFKSSYMGGGWWDDNEAVYTDEDGAVLWFEEQINPSDEEE